MDRITRILDFVNKNDGLNNTSKQPEPTHQQPPAPEPTTQQPPEIVKQDEIDMNEYLNDDKKYNALRRKLKKNKAFPCNIMGKAFYSQEEIDNYLDVLKDNKRVFNRNKKKEAIKNTKMNVADLDEINDDNIIEDDGYVYSTKKPMGIVKDNKKYKLPTTNKKDRHKIFDEVKNDKDAVNKLLSAKDDNEFNDITLSKIKDKNTLRRTKQHISNDISKDNTWNKNEFINLMEKIMTDETPTQQHQELEPDEPIIMPRSYGFNPKLFR